MASASCCLPFFPLCSKTMGRVQILMGITVFYSNPCGHLGHFWLFFTCYSSLCSELDDVYLFNQLEFKGNHLFYTYKSVYSTCTYMKSFIKPFGASGGAVRSDITWASIHVESENLQQYEVCLLHLQIEPASHPTSKPAAQSYLNSYWQTSLNPWLINQW